MKKLLILGILLLAAAGWAAGTACEICDCPAFQGKGEYCTRCGHAKSHHHR